ncbi:MAG: Sec-independent protein translocase protein TatB [Desulfovibrio sp.]|uniref:Sec-independent protein translocase protein TatB n=1 Tax=Desulfovibrio sp. 7SRBS1 TaxID=3378064 RepID=UPI003B3E71BC
MFGIGSTEILIICVVALLVIGPQKLPGFLRTLGKGLAEFKRMSSDVKSTLDHEIQRADMEERQKEAKKATKKAQVQAQKAGAEVVEKTAAVEEPKQETASDKTEVEPVATASAEPESSGDKA